MDIGRGAAMREFSVEVTVHFQRPIGNSREEAADYAEKLLTALEDDSRVLGEGDQRALGPVTWGYFDPPYLGARFNVQAPSANAAIERATAIFTDALRVIGLYDPLASITVLAVEEVEEEACAT